MKYILYARKSTESEDRQIQSIDDQKRTLLNIAQERNITIVEILEESKSAKTPRGRIVFNRMIEMIENNQIDGILCWDLSRLARNPEDDGKIKWLLQSGVLKSIITYTKEYTPENYNALVTSVEFGLTNQYIIDLSRNVKRGIESKLLKGWKSGLAPVGYLNDLEFKTIIKDPERFDLVRKMFDMFLSRKYTVSQILDIVNNDWHFRTKQRRNSGGKPLSRSVLYKIFSNIFYAGIIKFNGKEYQGKHEPIITLQEYDTIQSILGTKGNPRSKTKQFAYTGIIRCGECGSMVTAEEKINRFGSHYTYYHCTKRKKDIKCSQPSIEIKDLENQLTNILSNITIIDEFKDWAIEVLKEQNQKEQSSQYNIESNVEIQYKNIKTKMDNLTNALLDNLISSEEFRIKKEELKSELLRLEEKMHRIGNTKINWMDTAEKVFIFAHEAKRKFDTTKDLTEKRIILHALGSNPILKDKKLYIDIIKPLKIIEDGLTKINKNFEMLEPTEKTLSKRDYMISEPVRLTWLAYWDDYRTYICHP